MRRADFLANRMRLRGEVRDPTTPSPLASDGTGRSSQQFVMDILVRAGIYEVTAPIIVEAARMLLAGEATDLSGARSLVEVFNARAFPGAHGPYAASVSWGNVASPMLEGGYRIQAKRRFSAAR
jgi:hypothetical protein